MRTGLIIGGHGFIGSHLKKYFTDLGDKVYTVGEMDQYSFARSIKCDYVINCGAKIHAPLPELYKANVLDAVAYAKDFTESGRCKHYIHLGSSSEYGNQEDLSYETDVCQPNTDYAITKNLATRLILYNSPSSLAKVNIVRPFSIYGPNDRSSKFIPTIIKALKEQSDIQIYPGGHDWLHVRDFCSLIEALLKSNCDGEIFNACSQVCTVNEDVVNTLFDAVGVKTNKVLKYDTKYREYDRPFWMGSNEKALKLLGWKPMITLKEGLYDCYNQ
jgi:nucleoside-diphosphate-sugar epimerase